MTKNQAFLFMGVVSMLLFAGGFAAGQEFTHADLLQQCKGDEHGLRLKVNGTQYFYYCSYQKQ